MSIQDLEKVVLGILEHGLVEPCLTKALIARNIIYILDRDGHLNNSKEVTHD